MYARVRDTTLFFDVEGVGLRAEPDRMVQKPVAILVHGGPGGEHTNFKPVMSPLADRMQLVYYDHRGHGVGAEVRSPATPWRTTSKTWRHCASTWAWRSSCSTVSRTAAWWGCHTRCATRNPLAPDRRRHIAEPPIPHTRAGEPGRARDPEQQEIAERMFAGALRTTRLRSFFQTMWPLYSGKYDPAKANARWGKAIVNHEAINEGFGGFLRSYDGPRPTAQDHLPNADHLRPARLRYARPTSPKRSRPASPTPTCASSKRAGIRSRRTKPRRSWTWCGGLWCTTVRGSALTPQPPLPTVEERGCLVRRWAVPF